MGLQGTLAGYGFGGDRHLTLHGTGDRLARRDGSGGTPPYWAGGDLEAEGGSVTGRTLLAGTEFELGSETTSSGIACVWGRGGHSSFHGREGSFSLDGNVTTGTLGADYAKGPWTVGLALSHSRGEGRSSKDDVEAALTGLYPYAGYKITERFSVWGLGGFGRGGLTVTPDSGTSMETDISLLMIAAGARSLLLTAAHGMNVAFQDRRILGTCGLGCRPRPVGVEGGRQSAAIWAGEFVQGGLEEWGGTDTEVRDRLAL